MNVSNTIRKKLNEHNLSVAELERRAGLKGSAVRNILRGHSKKPNFQILQAIATVFGCEVNDLLDAENEVENSEKLDKKLKKKELLTLEDPKLFLQVGETVIASLQPKHKDITLDQLLKIIKESYAYSIKQEPKEANVRFIEWMIDKIVR